MPSHAATREALKKQARAEVDAERKATVLGNEVTPNPVLDPGKFNRDVEEQKRVEAENDDYERPNMGVPAVGKAKRDVQEQYRQEGKRMPNPDTERAVPTMELRKSGRTLQQKFLVHDLRKPSGEPREEWRDIPGKDDAEDDGK